MPHGNRVYIDAGTWVGGTEDSTYNTEYQVGSYVEVETLNAAPVNKRDEADGSYAVLTNGELQNLKLIPRTPVGEDHSVELTDYSGYTAGEAGEIIYVSAAS